MVATSSGNQAWPFAHAARAAGILPDLATQHILPVYRDTLRDRGAELQTVPDMKARTVALHEKIKEGWFPLSVAPEDRGRRTQLGKSGYAAIAREIVDALGAAPDFLILPVCFGDGCAGILLGFRQLARERGTAIPKFIMIRATYAEDVAFSITSDITTPEVADTLAATDGVSMYFKNADFLEAQRQGRKRGGSRSVGPRHRSWPCPLRRRSGVPTWQHHRAALPRPSTSRELSKRKRFSTAWKTFFRFPGRRTRRGGRCAGGLGHVALFGQVAVHVVAHERDRAQLLALGFL